MRQRGEQPRGEPLIAVRTADQVISTYHCFPIQTLKKARHKFGGADTNGKATFLEEIVSELLRSTLRLWVADWLQLGTNALL